jgi:hypothetical protein
VQTGHTKFLDALGEIYKAYSNSTHLTSQSEAVFKAHAEMFPEEESELRKAWEAAKVKFLRTQGPTVEEPHADLFNDLYKDQGL